jgi:putative transposase
MKAHTVELRERIVGYVENGGSKTDAAAHFKVGRRSVYRYLEAARGGSLAPKPQPGRKRAFADESLRREVKAHPSATLESHGKALGVSRNAVWLRLRQLKITLKKNS